MIAQKFFSPMITPTIAVRDRLTLFFNDAASLSTSIQSIEAQPERTTNFRNRVVSRVKKSMRGIAP